MAFFLTILAVVLADQLSKWWLIETLSLHETVTVIPGFFNLTHIHNTGAAFGLFAGEGGDWRLWFFGGVSFVALLALIALYRNYRAKGFPYALALGLIGGGAIGNLIDRFSFGSVVDFLDVYIGPYHWPAFNLADSAICVGIGLFIWANFFRDT